MVQRLAQHNEVNRRSIDRRLLQIPQPELQILESHLLRLVRAEKDDRFPTDRFSSRPDSCRGRKCVEIRDFPIRVTCWISLTESSSFSSKATIRSRVGSASARRDFRVSATEQIWLTAVQNNISSYLDTSICR